jgi:DNA transformation protein
MGPALYAAPRAVTTLSHSHAMETDIESLTGIGRVSAAWLRRAGIRTRADLQRIGVVEAYKRVCGTGVKPSLNLLWAMEGALTDMHWTLLTPHRRDELRRLLEQA